MRNRIIGTKYLYLIFDILLFTFFVQRTSEIFGQGGFLYYAIPILIAIVSLIIVNRDIIIKIKSVFPYIIWQLGFTLFCVLSYKWSFTPATSNNNAFILNIALMIPIALYLSKTDRVKEYLIVIFLAILFVEMYAIFIDKLDLELYEGSLRLNNENYNANSIAILSVTSIFILLTQYRKNNLLKILLVILNIAIIILSASKKGFLMLIIGLITYFSMKNKKNKFIRLFFYSLALLILAFLVLQIPIVQNTIGNRLNSFFNELLNNNGDSSSDARIEMIIYGTKWFFEKPIFGHGIDNFRYYYQEVSRFRISTYSHNNYIELLFGVGIIGAFLYYLFYFSIFRNIAKKKNDIWNNRFLLFSIIFMIMLCVGELALVTYNARWIQLFILLIYHISSRKKIMKNTEEGKNEI